MFFNLKIMLRNLQRGGIYSVINIGGLAIGMTVSILLFAAIYHQLSFDRFHPNAKRLYVAYSRTTTDGRIYVGATPSLLGTTLKTDYPETARVARMSTTTSLVANDDAKLKIQTGYIDPDFLNMFNFPLLQGNAETVLNDPYSVILTEKAAIQLFGQDDPIGKTLLLNNQYSITVTGVMKDLPNNTSFRFEALAPLLFQKATDVYSENWSANRFITYVELHPNVNLDLFNEKIRDIAKNNSSEQNEVFLYPLVKQRLYYFSNGVPTGGAWLAIMYFLGAIALFTLLIACINYMNLSTARSIKRAKEVGIRKVAGAKRVELIKLFLGESTLISFIAGVIALVIVLIVLFLPNEFLDMQLALKLGSVWFWLAGINFILITGLLAGCYPAFYLSAFNPVNALKGIAKIKQGLFSPRKVLVVTQFIFASILMTAVIDVNRQIKTSQNRDVGYDMSHLIYVPFDGDIAKNYELIRHDLLSSMTAVSITKTSSAMTQIWSSTRDVDWKGKAPEARFNFNTYFVDASWAKTTGVTIVEGRDIDIYTYPMDSTAIVLNESAVKIMNLENPIGELVKIMDKDWHVVGVVKDIVRQHFESITPMIIGGPGGRFYTMHIKLNDNKSMQSNLAKVEQIFKQHNPTYPFDYRFIDEEHARDVRSVKNYTTLGTWFAVFAVFVACMGLYALVAYIAETRRKEIGIRKVMGASVSNIIILLSKEFLNLALISTVIAFPLTWFVIEKTQYAGYPLYTSIPWWLFIVIVCINLFITMLTVSFQAIKAATENPVEALKSE